ncbi:DUF1499 domain-containing protein [Tautonia marina]|uniref:DUF1499 domain-containing protein n=1 Tax=Tautonia marina TaxID=2653855 RepID=UPI0012611E0F|nr:DUF1499 domain-containing protein [Tautonia marina]
MTRTRKLAQVLALIVPIAVLIVYRILPSKSPANLGVEDGRLAGCPDSPNCVSSQSDDPEHRVEPLPLRGSASEALGRLKSVLEAMPRTRIVDERNGYLHAEATSLVFGFIDDLEFLVDEDEQVIHVRSASRVGHSDLGVNRDRVERIREAYGQSGGGE